MARVGKPQVLRVTASPLFAGVGRANNAGNVGNANNVYGVAASNV